MKPAPFEYLRPATIDEACAALAADPDARLIAGGQTLVPMMAMRLARPTRLVDIARIPALKGIREEAGHLVLGAATRQVEAERSDLVRARLPLLAAALPWVGHAPTRNRGTVGGSLANADPAAEIGLVLVTLDGEVTQRADGKNERIRAADVFMGPMTTSIAPAACLVDVRFPVWTERNVGVAFDEVSARKSDFAYVSAAAQVALDDSGRCTRLAIGIGGATPVPTMLASVCDALAGTKLESGQVRDAMRAAAEGLEIMRDSHASESYRRRVAASLGERVLLAAADAARKKTAGVPA